MKKKWKPKKQKNEKGKNEKRIVLKYIMLQFKNCLKREGGLNVDFNGNMNNWAISKMVKLSHPLSSPISHSKVSALSSFSSS